MADTVEMMKAVGPAIARAWAVRLAGLQLLEGGMNSVTFTADLDVGKYIAKWVPQRDSEQLRLGAEAARLMDAAGIRSGTPLPTVDGTYTASAAGGELVLLEFVPGKPLTAAAGDQADWGRSLGKVHAAGIRPAGISFFDWVERDGQDKLYARWVRNAAKRIAVEMRSLPPLSWVQLHTDPEPGAFRRDDEGQIAVIDWTGSTAGPALYDVASAVMYAGGELEAGALLGAYLTTSPVGEEELRRYLPTFHRFRAVVQAVYFSGRVQEANFHGGGGTPENEKGLRDAHHMLSELESPHHSLRSKLIDIGE